LNTGTEAGPSHPATWDYGTAGDEYGASGGCTMEDLLGMGDDDYVPDVIGASQLPGAPPPQSQDPLFQTPPQSVRPRRDVAPPSRFTYSADHVNAQQQVRRARRRRDA
jgi:hypothetical protein